ncbi:hypothetical protein FRX31_018936 [Thalictrum thalictroides]|uniref:Uncharacterized protein n=1 Tax=Thalictrum thalictroides TaxID=46969 RepID=A0A7J6W3V9_THATH|nr:hypothetical protein FRX31_018936 [Thalictrum thalictroides]
MFRRVRIQDPWPDQSLWKPANQQPAILKRGQNLPFTKGKEIVIDEQVTSSGQGSEEATNDCRTSTMPDRSVITESLLKCNSHGDFRNWIKWFVMPIAGELSMTTSLGTEGQLRMFTEVDGMNGIRPMEDAIPVGKEVDLDGEASTVLHGDDKFDNVD